VALINKSDVGGNFTLAFAATASERVVVNVNIKVIANGCLVSLAPNLQPVNIS
jgi:hypothetical protein